MMNKFKLSKDNPYKNMPNDQFIKQLESNGFKVINGTGKIYGEDEATKGRMKVSRKKVSIKSKHKHDYHPVLIIHKFENGDNWYHAGVRCSICGKVKWDQFLFNKLTDTTFPLLGFNDTDFQEQYRGLEIVENE